MPESNQIPRKRMRFTSSSASEILTKSKSQYQRNRFGRTAPAVSHTGNGFNHSPSLTGKITPKFVRTYPRVTIKDLRLRRVFTPSSIPSDWEFKIRGETRTKEQDDGCPYDSLISNIAKEGTKVDAEAEESLETTPHDPELLSSGPVCEEINGSAVKKCGTNLCGKSVLHPCSRAKIFKNPGSFSYKRLLPYLMQAADGTPSGRCSKPDKLSGENPPNVCNKGEVAEDPKEEASELMKAKCQLPETTKTVAQTVDVVVVNKHSAGSLCGNTSPLTKACSRRKLFKTPGSVNYRRMLPYLRDIREVNPCVPETVNHPGHKKNTEENTPLSMLASDNEGTQDMLTSCIARESGTCSNEDIELVPCEPVSVSSERSDPDKEQETQVKHVILDTEKNLETPHNAFGSEVQFSSPIVGSSSPSEFASSALNNIFVEKLAGEEIMHGSEKTEAKNNAEQLKEDSSDSTAELVDPSVVLGTPSSISPSKGILKRSIRGCRGICSCLNCSSFRLNAERAFEFSRNQLQDTEVMVLDLVGEISHLREMLEKYSSADHNESYKSQAGDAAKRASEAADLAKGRLHQMNDDLQVHCRIPNEQRARVKFAHYVHEKTILKAQPNNLIPRSL